MAKISSMTGFTSTEIETWFRSQRINYLWDPITQSIVSYEKSVPLYDEALTFYNIIKEKYQ